MRAVAVVLALFLVLATPGALCAQDTLAGDVDVPAGADRIVVVREDAVVPFTGQLFDQATALRWANRTVRYRTRIRLLEEELTAVRTELEASTARQIHILDESYGTQLRLQQESFEREITGLRADLREQATRYEGELARYRNPPFWESWGFAFGMGVVVTGVVVGLVGGLVLGI